jgi:hypothetical protein
VGCLRVPLDAIESVAIVPATAAPGVPLGLAVERDALTVLRGGARGQVRVVLTRPVLARYQARRTAPVTRFHLALEDAPSVLAAVRRRSPTP